MENNQTSAVATETNATTTQVSTNSNVANSNTSNVNYDEIFKKLDSILDKRSEGIAKSALKDNGYEDAEMKDILTQYRASKQAKANEADNTISTLTTDLEKTRALLQEERLNNEALNQARGLNVDDKTVPYLIKMADLKGCFDDKGNVTPEKVKSALEQVLNDVPSLKQSDKGTAGVTVGADASTSNTPSGNMFNFGFTGVRKHD